MAFNAFVRDNVGKDICNYDSYEHESFDMEYVLQHKQKDCLKIRGHVHSYIVLENSHLVIDVHARYSLLRNIRKVLRYHKRVCFSV